MPAPEIMIEIPELVKLTEMSEEPIEEPSLLEPMKIQILMEPEKLSGVVIHPYHENVIYQPLEHIEIPKPESTPNFWKRLCVCGSGKPMHTATANASIPEIDLTEPIC